MASLSHPGWALAQRTRAPHNPPNVLAIIRSEKCRVKIGNGRAEGLHSGHLTEAAAIARPVRRFGSVRGERAISGAAKEGRGHSAAAVLLQRIGDEAVSCPRAAFPARSGAVETGGVRRAARAPAALSAHSDTVATGIRRGRYAEQSLFRASIALTETMRTGWTCA
ncbi:hypothetical protein trd_1654 [Thermomicrobium roseum DSM 5159]|uniref:Uncharacterized protein n=1 Tax=Thermomicrobium roseum (strain ATCC 27502 / DSM 5159 / P-2) TaxID=309801 RepID=B9L0F9_THERP|nr:hypothetical protein trd_1654 [Thermomicrobium roseum DSM 5159]